MATTTANPTDEVEEHHRGILETLKKGGQLDPETLDKEQTIYHDAKERHLLLRIAEEIAGGNLEYNHAAKSTISHLLKVAPGIMMCCQGMEGKSPLDFAITGNPAVCLGLVKQLCEEGPTEAARRWSSVQSKQNTTGPKGASTSTGGLDRDTVFDRAALLSGVGAEVTEEADELYKSDEPDEHGSAEWENIWDTGVDTCLHKAIKWKRREYASYLIRRIKDDGATDVLLHKGHDDLTPLHVAVAYKNLTKDQDTLVEELIEACPDALKSKARVHPERKAAERRSGAEKAVRKKGSTPETSLTPLRYFLHTRELHGERANAPQIGRARAPQDMSQDLTKAAGKLERLLKLSCMRHFGNERETIVELLPDKLGHIHLDFTRRNKVSGDLLEDIGKLARFENILQYVSIPNVQVKSMDPAGDAKEGWKSSYRKDYVHIFDWLRSKKVERILRIFVEDGQDDFHSDEAIEHALDGFEVESWDWMRSDICSQVIVNAAPDVRDLTLYWSGNHAILRSWAANDGLAKLRQLRNVVIMRRKTGDSEKRIKQNIGEFRERFEMAWRSQENTLQKNGDSAKLPDVEFRLDPSKGVAAEIPAEAKRAERVVEERKEEWFNYVERFAKFLNVYFRNQPLKDGEKIKVAVIDDGADIDSPGIRGNVAAGDTFYNNGGRWQGFYQSSTGHGTLMASLICEVCPKAQLYIAKLNEEYIGSRPQITADSAAKAIDWARKKGVDIISMSWSIKDPGRWDFALKAAVERAAGDNILLFYASNDQGNSSSESSYPAAYRKGFCIGAATVWGHEDPAVQSSVNYIAPGAKNLKGKQRKSAAGAAECQTQTGSSIATARCAGLAALMLQCIALAGNDKSKVGVRQYGKMKKMLDFLAKDENDQQGKYLQVGKILNELDVPRAHVNDNGEEVLRAIKDRLVNIAR